MKNLLFSLILIFNLFIISCDLQYGICDEDNIKIGSIYNYDFEGSENIPAFENIDKAMTWVRWFLENKRDIDVQDVEDYWQTPEESYKLKTGDCEDHAILYMFILKRQFNLDSYLVIVKQLMGIHAIVYIPSIDKYYDPMNDSIYQNNEIAKKQTLEQYIYSQALWLAVNYHTSI